MNVDCRKKIDFFDQCDTKPEEWILCEMIYCNHDDWGNVLYPRFRVDQSYQFVPESDNIKTTKWENLHADDKRCRICGQELVHCFMIKHDGKKFVTIIGRNCAKKYPNLNFEVQLKEMLDNKFRPVFMSWSLTAEKHIMLKEGFQREDSKQKMKTRSSGRLHLQEQPKKLLLMIRRLRNKKVGYIQMRKVLFLADELRIQIPYSLLSLIKKKSIIIS
ncbi:MAG: hypothetical protein ACREAK_02315 [Nitrosarchaeum sp.]